jgi:hypothetical protein
MGLGPRDESRLDYFFDRETFDSDEEEEICLYRDDQTDADILRNSHCRGDLLKTDLQTGAADWTPRSGHVAP